MEQKTIHFHPTYKIIKRLESKAHSQNYLLEETGSSGKRKKIVLKRILKSNMYQAEIYYILMKEKPFGFVSIEKIESFPSYLDVYETYINGKTIIDLVSSKTEISLGVALTWLESLYLALKKIHSRHPFAVIHGDISPGNILVCENNRAYFTDYQSCIEIKEKKDYERNHIFITRGFASKEKENQWMINEKEDFYALERSFHWLVTQGKDYLVGSKEELAVFEKRRKTIKQASM